MKTHAALKFRRTNGLTSGGFFASMGSLIKTLPFRERLPFSATQPG
jgi:hypothetical protein